VRPNEKEVARLKGEGEKEESRTRKKTKKKPDNGFFPNLSFPMRIWQVEMTSQKGDDVCWLGASVLLCSETSV